MEKLKEKQTAINLTAAEIQSEVNRVLWAEGLIKELPKDHNGRNSWLLNFGQGGEAMLLRARRGLKFINETQACETVVSEVQHMHLKGFDDK